METLSDDEGPPKPRSPLLSSVDSVTKKSLLARNNSVQFTLPGYMGKRRPSREDTPSSPANRRIVRKGSVGSPRGFPTVCHDADKQSTRAPTRAESPESAGSRRRSGVLGEDQLMTFMKDTTLLEQTMQKMEKQEERDAQKKQIDLVSLKLSMVAVARRSFSDDSDADRLSSRSSGDEGLPERPQSPLSAQPSPRQLQSTPNSPNALGKSDALELQRRRTNSMDLPPVPPRRSSVANVSKSPRKAPPGLQRTESCLSPCRPGRFGQPPAVRPRLPKAPPTAPSALGLKLSRQPSSDEPVSRAASELTKRLMQRSALSGTTLFRSRRLTVAGEDDSNQDTAMPSTSPISAVQVEMMTFQRRLEAQDSDATLEETLAAAGVGQDQQERQLLGLFMETLTDSWKLDLFKRFLRTSHLDAALSFFVESEECCRLMKGVRTFEEQALCVEVALNTCNMYKSHEDLGFIHSDIKAIVPKIKEHKAMLETLDTSDLTYDRTFGLRPSLFESVQKKVRDILVLEQFPNFLCSHNSIRTTPQMESAISTSSGSLEWSGVTFSVDSFNDFGSEILTDPPEDLATDVELQTQDSARPRGLFSLVKESLCGGKLSIEAQFGEEDTTENILFSTSRDGKRQVDAATHAKLVEHLTDPAIVDSEFQFACLVCALYFTDTHMQFLQLLRGRFNSVTTPPIHLITAEQKSAFKRQSVPTVIKIATVLKIFIDLHYHHIAGNKEFINFLDRFIAVEVHEVMPTIYKNLKSFVDRKLASQDEPEEEFQFDTKPPKSKLSRSLTSAKPEEITILMVHPVEAARQLTIVDHAFFRKIVPCECVNMNWTREEKESLAPNVLANIRQFCNLSLFVGTSIVTIEDMTKRTQTLGRFIKIAYECLKLKNLNSAMAIVSGLQNHPVYRLKCTWAKLQDKYWDIWEELKDVFKCDENFAALRTYMRRITPPAVPYLGMYLSDLTFIDNEKNFIDGGQKMVNFAKMLYVSGVIMQIQQYQQAAYCLEPVPILQHLFNNMPTSSEAELYKLSVVRESKTFQASFRDQKQKKRRSFFKSRDK